MIRGFWKVSLIIYYLQSYFTTAQDSLLSTHACKDGLMGLLEIRRLIFKLSLANSLNLCFRKMRE